MHGVNPPSPAVVAMPTRLGLRIRIDVGIGCGARANALVYRDYGPI
jgi:hypothetical protein